MPKRLWTVFAALGALQAQQVMTPTPEQVGLPRGDNKGDYNITQSFEAGYRFSTVAGDVGEYRSAVNYGNGIRLFGSSLTVNSRDGHGQYFDEILLNTSGLGNDPYESVMLRIEKNQLYRYDMTWRQSDYYNPGLTVAGGLHFMNTVQTIQDHDVTILPQSKISFHAGYSRSTENGPALSTAQEFDQNGYGLPIFTNVKRQWNEYRVGADVTFAGFKFIVTRRWDYYKDDTPATLAGVVAVGTPNDQTVLQQFARSQPVHGSTPGWLGNLFTRRKRWGMNARLTYLTGHSDFALVETAAGLDQFGQPANRQILVGGNAKRPDLAGDLLLNVSATNNVTVSNSTSISSNRIDGDSSYSEYFTGLNLGTTIYFRYLGVRLITNATDINYHVSDRFGIYGGFHYSDRQVNTIEAFTLPAFTGAGSSASYSVTNVLRTGLLGLRFRLTKDVTMKVDGQVGRNTSPLVPIDGNYHTIGGRIDYRTPKLQLSANARELYSNNDQQGFSLFASHSRTYSVNGSLPIRSWFSIDASYVKLHLNTQSFLAFFAGTTRPTLQTAYPSIYVSNIHSGNLGGHIGLTRRADLYLGYSIVKDTGDGRSTQVLPLAAVDPVTALLSSVQTFPLTYQSPLARLSIKISQKVRWNVGWQYYGYGEQFQLLGYYQNFHANTGYTSLLWSF